MNKNKTICFYDFEATGISRDADMISLGIVAITEKSGYGKLTTKLFEDAVDNLRTTHGVSDETLSVHGVYKQLESLQQPEIKTFYCEFNDFNIDKCDNWVKENIVGKLRFKDYRQRKSNLLLNTTPHCFKGDNNVELIGDTSFVSEQLKEWLSQFEEVEFWADFDVIDKPMLIDLIVDWEHKSYYDTSEIENNFQRKIDSNGYDTIEFTHKEQTTKGSTIEHHKIKQYKIGLPKHLPNIRYDQFFDLHTLFKLKGVDTDINREEFVLDYEEAYLNYTEQCDKLGLTVDKMGGKHNALYDSFIAWKCFKKLIKL